MAQTLKIVMEDRAKAYFAEQFECEVSIPLRVELVAGPSWGEAVPIPIKVTVS